MTILAGDIGGTKTLLQIATDRAHETPLAILYEQRFISAEFSSFNKLLDEFLSAARQANVPMPTNACIGVAGPVVVDEQENYTATVTNLPWLLDTKKLSAQFTFHHLRLINDFQAVGYGLEVLHADELSVLQAGEIPQQQIPSPCVLIGAGTGLGQGILIWNGDADTGHYDVFSSEGGHGDFSPGSSEQAELLSFLLAQSALTKQPGRVSVEDVLSGRGLVNVYHYFADKHPEMVTPALAQAMREGDAASEVSIAALSATDPLAERALDLFVEIYGSQAGDFALTCLATGGIFIAGGIAAKIQPRMMDGLFLKAFQNKGPMLEMMKKIPVKLVMDPHVGLKGALLVASRL